MDHSNGDEAAGESGDLRSGDTYYSGSRDNRNQSETCDEDQRLENNCAASEAVQLKYVDAERTKLDQSESHAVGNLNNLMEQMYRSDDLDNSGGQASIDVVRTVCNALVTDTSIRDLNQPIDECHDLFDNVKQPDNANKSSNIQQNADCSDMCVADGSIENKSQCSGPLNGAVSDSGGESRISPHVLQPCLQTRDQDREHHIEYSEDVRYNDLYDDVGQEDMERSNVVAAGDGRTSSGNVFGEQRSIGAERRMLERDPNHETRRPDTLGAINQLSQAMSSSSAPRFNRTGDDPRNVRSLSDSGGGGAGVGWGRMDGRGVAGGRVSPGLAGAAAPEDRIFNRLKLRQRTRAAGMDEAELQQRQLIAATDDVDDDDDEANGEGVEDEGEEYPDITGQCESTEADQYKMNPEADQSESGGIVDLIRHSADNDDRGEDDNEEDGEVEGQLLESYSSGEEDQREGDGSRGLTEDDQEYGASSNAVRRVNEEYGGSSNVVRRVNQEYGASNAERRINRSVEDNGRNASSLWTNRNADGSGHSPEWTNRNAEADGSGPEPNASSRGSSNRNTPADGSGSGHSPLPSNQVTRLQMNRDEAADLIGHGLRNETTSSVGQRPATASGSDDEAFLSRQRLAPRSPLRQHPRSAFAQPPHLTGGAAIHDAAGDGGFAGIEHSGGVGQESDDVERYHTSSTAVRSAQAGTGNNERIGNEAVDNFTFKPIVTAAHAKYGSGFGVRRGGGGRDEVRAGGRGKRAREEDDGGVGGVSWEDNCAGRGEGRDDDAEGQGRLGGSSQVGHYSHNQQSRALAAGRGKPPSKGGQIGSTASRGTLSKSSKPTKTSATGTVKPGSISGVRTVPGGRNGDSGGQSVAGNLSMSKLPCAVTSSIREQGACSDAPSMHLRQTDHRIGSPSDSTSSNTGKPVNTSNNSLNNNTAGLVASNHTGGYRNAPGVMVGQARAIDMAVGYYNPLEIHRDRPLERIEFDSRMHVGSVENSQSNSRTTPPLRDDVDSLNESPNVNNSHVECRLLDEVVKPLGRNTDVVLNHNDSRSKGSSRFSNDSIASHNGARSEHHGIGETASLSEVRRDQPAGGALVDGMHLQVTENSGPHSIGSVGLPRPTLYSSSAGTALGENDFSDNEILLRGPSSEAYHHHSHSQHRRQQREGCSWGPSEPSANNRTPPSVVPHSRSAQRSRTGGYQLLDDSLEMSPIRPPSSSSLLCQPQQLQFNSPPIHTPGRILVGHNPPAHSDSHNRYDPAQYDARRTEFLIGGSEGSSTSRHSEHQGVGDLFAPSSQFHSLPRNEAYKINGQRDPSHPWTPSRNYNDLLAVGDEVRRQTGHRLPLDEMMSDTGRGLCGVSHALFGVGVASQGLSGSGGSTTGAEIFNVDELRSKLRGLLTFSDSTMPDKSNYDETNNDADHLLLSSGRDVISSSPYGRGLMSAGASSGLVGRSSVSGGIVAGLCEALPLSSRYIGVGPGAGGQSMSSLDTATLVAENRALCDTMEQQRFRRKHCEKQIQLLQGKVLELQQQLAVAISTDRKKDVMLEQFDKALAKIVESWRVKDVDRQQLLQRLNDENASLRRSIDDQNNVVSNLEAKLNQALRTIVAEQQRSERISFDKDAEIAALVSDRTGLRAALDNEREQWRRTVDAERTTTSEERARVYAEQNAMRANQDEERAGWREREAELVRKADETAEGYRRTLDSERAKREQREHAYAELEAVLRASQSTIEQLEMEVNTANREKESLKVEMGLSEARLESSRRMLDMELSAQHQRAFAEKLAEAERKHADAERTIHESHRKQIHELCERHRDELRTLNAEHQSAVQWLDDKNREREEVMEGRLRELEGIMAQMEAENRTVEQHKAEVTAQLQMMMQAHCEEAMQLLRLNKAAASCAADDIGAGESLKINDFGSEHRGNVGSSELSGSRNRTVLGVNRSASDLRFNIADQDRRADNVTVEWRDSLTSSSRNLTENKITGSSALGQSAVYPPSSTTGQDNDSSGESSRASSVSSVRPATSSNSLPANHNQQMQQLRQDVEPKELLRQMQEQLREQNVYKSTSPELLSSALANGITPSNYSAVPPHLSTNSAAYNLSSTPSNPTLSPSSLSSQYSQFLASVRNFQPLVADLNFSIANVANSVQTFGAGPSTEQNYKSNTSQDNGPIRNQESQPPMTGQATRPIISHQRGSMVGSGGVGHRVNFIMSPGSDDHSSPLEQDRGGHANGAVPLMRDWNDDVSVTSVTSIAKLHSLISSTGSNSIDDIERTNSLGHRSGHKRRNSPSKTSSQDQQSVGINKGRDTRDRRVSPGNSPRREGCGNSNLGSSPRLARRVTSRDDVKSAGRDSSAPPIIPALTNGSKAPPTALTALTNGKEALSGTVTNGSRSLLLHEVLQHDLTSGSSNGGDSVLNIDDTMTQLTPAQHSGSGIVGGCAGGSSLQQQEQRHQELQHYIRLLLQRSPGDSTSDDRSFNPTAQPNHTSTIMVGPQLDVLRQIGKAPGVITTAATTTATNELQEKMSRLMSAQAWGEVSQLLQQYGGGGSGGEGGVKPPGGNLLAYLQTLTNGSKGGEAARNDGQSVAAMERSSSPVKQLKQRDNKQQRLDEQRQQENNTQRQAQKQDHIPSPLSQVLNKRSTSVDVSHRVSAAPDDKRVRIAASSSDKQTIAAVNGGTGPQPRSSTVLPPLGYPAPLHGATPSHGSVGLHGPVSSQGGEVTAVVVTKKYKKEAKTKTVSAWK